MLNILFIFLLTLIPNIYPLAFCPAGFFLIKQKSICIKQARQPENQPILYRKQMVDFCAKNHNSLKLFYIGKCVAKEPSKTQGFFTLSEVAFFVDWVKAAKRHKSRRIGHLEILLSLIHST